MNKKHYELTDWLGNVRVVINDKKTPQGTNASDMTYQAQTISVSDYYPFGMLSRSYSVGGYRFGFNTQERDDEIYGLGNSYTARFWQYDARLGRRWNLDPVFKEFESPFASFANNPIWFVDILGADSTQRANAVAMAKEFVAKNPSMSGKLYGGKGTKPGMPTDCSGLVSACVIAGGEPDPNKALKGGQRRKNGKQSGVLNIEDNTIEVPLKNVQVGNLYTMHKESDDSYHIGIISKVIKDKDGNVVGLYIIHSEINRGPVEDYVNMLEGNRWTNRPHKILKWDTKPDVKKITNKDVQNQTNANMYNSATAKAQYKENQNNNVSDWWNDFINDVESFWNEVIKASDPSNWYKQYEQYEQ